MAELFWIVVFVYALSQAAEKAKKEYRGVRDHHAANLARDHKDWHPARIKRQAALRAQAHWWNQFTHHSGGRWQPFPAFRAAFGDSRLRAKAEAAEAHADGVTSRHELRQRIAAAHERAEAARAASQGARGGASGGTLVTASGGAAGDAFPLPSEPVGGVPSGAPAQVPSEGDLRDSSWLEPGEPRCEGCGGSGRNADGTDACPACRGFGSAAPDPKSPPAKPDVICGACGHQSFPGDPVLLTDSGPLHRSHAVKQQAAYRDALQKLGHGDCTECGLPLGGEHDGWSHKRCDDVLEKERAATEVRDNRDLEVVESGLRAQERCPHQTGTGGGNTYCGRDITGTGGDREDEYCLEHQAKFDGDEEGAFQEHWEYTQALLERDAANPDITRRADGQPETDADKRFFDLRESGYTGPIDQDGRAVMTRTDGAGQPLPLFKGGTGHGTPDDDWPTGRRRTDQHGPRAAANGTTTTQSPATEGPAMTTGTDTHDTALEGADTPHEAMQGVFQGFASEAARTAAAANDDLAAAAAAHGYDRDPQVMADIAEISDLAAALAARAQQARTGLQQRHADGAEYHANGQDAHASAFRPS